MFLIQLKHSIQTCLSLLVSVQQKEHRNTKEVWLQTCNSVVFARSEYYEIALWIRENVPHDQFLLEYQSGGSGNPWLHISLTPTSNRFEIATFYNHRRYKDRGKFYQIYA